MPKKKFSNCEAFQSSWNNYSLCPRTLKMCLFSTFQDGKLQAWFWCEGQIHRGCWCLQNCVSVIYFCVRKWNEATTNTYAAPESTANSGTKFTTLKMHMAQGKENLYPIWICSCDRTVYDHSNVIYYTKVEKRKEKKERKNLQVVSFSLFDWQQHKILAWLPFPRREQQPRCVAPELGFHYAIGLTLAVITAPVYWRKSSSSSLSLLWELDMQTQCPPPHVPRALPACREMRVKSANYKYTNGHWKILLTQRFTHFHTPESAGLFSQLLNNVWRGLLPQGNEKPYFSLYRGGLII